MTLWYETNAIFLNPYRISIISEFVTILFSKSLSKILAKIKLGFWNRITFSLSNFSSVV